jgi:hypothetical protein
MQRLVEGQRWYLDTGVHGKLGEQALRDAAVPLADAAGPVEELVASSNDRRLAIAAGKALGIGASLLPPELRNFTAKLALGEGCDAIHQVDSLALRDGRRIEPVPTFCGPRVATAASGDRVDAEKMLHDVLLPHGAVDLVARANEPSCEENIP